MILNSKATLLACIDVFSHWFLAKRSEQEVHKEPRDYVHEEVPPWPGTPVEKEYIVKLLVLRTLPYLHPCTHTFISACV